MAQYSPQFGIQSQSEPRRLEQRLPDVAERRRMAAWRGAGVGKDASQARALLDQVRGVDDELHYYTALHALARIGGPDALLAAEEATLQLAPGSEAQHYACAVRARLLAQNAAHSLHAAAPARQAQAAVDTLLQTLGQNAAAFNAAVAQERLEYRRSLHPYDGLATFALRELADMIYHNRDLTLLKAAQDSGIRFDLDVGAQYKAQLAPLSSQKRVDWIVNDLSSKKALSFDEYFLIQLAADEGRIASHAAAARLQEMEKQREHYVHSGTDSSGRIHRHFGSYYGLMYIINCVAAPEQEPFIASLLNDPEPDIASHARKVYQCFQEGVGPQYKISY